MRDCVLWSIQRENRIKCIASTELQHWVHVKVIVCRKQYYGYQRQTFHFIIGAWGLNIMTKSSEFLNWLIAHLCYLTRFETTHWNSWNTMCLICYFHKSLLSYVNVIFCPARGLDQLLHWTLGAGRHLLTFLSRSRNLRTRWGSFLQCLSTLCEKVYSSRLKCWRGFKLYKVSAQMTIKSILCCFANVQEKSKSTTFYII